MRKLTISKEYGSFLVDDKSRPGSPPVGRGRTIKEAIGDWLHNNQSLMDVQFEVDTTAEPAVKRWFNREWSKR